MIIVKVIGPTSGIAFGPKPGVTLASSPQPAIFTLDKAKGRDTPEKVAASIRIQLGALPPPLIRIYEEGGNPVLRITANEMYDRVLKVVDIATKKMRSK